jgi:hypothetical protein
MISFFTDFPEYRIAEPFLDITWGGMQTDDTTLKEFTNHAWERFNPYSDNRLEYIVTFWQGHGLSMNGSYESFWEFESWIYRQAAIWREKNPNRVYGARDPALWKELLSIARDMAIYGAYCTTSALKLNGRWVKWEGRKSEVTRGLPFFIVDGCEKLHRIYGLNIIVSYVICATTAYEKDNLVSLGSLTRQVVANIETVTGNLPTILW